MSGPVPDLTPPVRVLVADDQALVRTGFATILGAQDDLEVVGEASDGRAAVELGRRLRPDVVVMDVRMPVLDGIEATRALAGPQAPDPLKVLVVTTFNLDSHVYDALRAGASGFLLKDAPPGELVAAVRTVAAGTPCSRPPSPGPSSASTPPGCARPRRLPPGPGR